MTTSLLVYSGNDPQYLAIVWHLAQGARERGENPALLDLTPIVPGIGDTYHRGLLRALGRSAPDRRFATLLADDDFEVLEPDRTPVALPPAAQVGVTESVRSALISYARDPLPRTSRGLWGKLERTLHTSALDAFSALVNALDARPEFDTVYVANGRFPHQRSVIEAARFRGRDLRYYEKGEAADTYWFEDHSTLDRIVTQENVDTVLGPLSAEEALEVGRGWMNARSSRGNASNIYARFFGDDSGIESEPRERKLIGFFTSSQDEFAALGPEWHVQAWTDQMAAFDHALTHLEQFGHDFFLRIHPNFITKSHPSFVREREQVRELQRAHPALRIFWHDEQVNSYALVQQADAVVVWDSTVGMEASGRGTPVWEMAASYYDLYADVRTWFSPDDDPTEAELFYEVDVDRTHRFMAYLVRRDRALPPEAIAVRDDLTPHKGLALSIASLGTSGGAPTVPVAASAVVDTVRHRRFAINRMALRRFLTRR